MVMYEGLPQAIAAVQKKKKIVNTKKLIISILPYFCSVLSVPGFVCRTGKVERLSLKAALSGYSPEIVFPVAIQRTTLSELPQSFQCVSHT